jgi:hypothetical protein
MNRRELIKMIPAAAALPAMGVLSRDSSISGADDYRGFKLWWSGWMRPVNQMVFCGQWIAHNPKGPERWHVYSAYPGPTDKIFAGMMMNVSLQEGQAFLTPYSTSDEFDSAKGDAFMRLIAYIDEHYQELTK